MPNLKDIRRRISSVQKTQQITRAMRMVAAAKLRRAQQAIEAARPYADELRATLAEVALSDPQAEHPLLVAREAVRNVDFLVVTSDRGLCGAFNGNVLKRAELELDRRERELEGFGLVLAGRKGAEYFRRRHRDRVAKVKSGMTRVAYEDAIELADYVQGRFESGEADEVILVHSAFVSVMTQRPRCVRLLPMIPEAEEDGGDEEPEALPYTFEPSAEQLLGMLAPKALRVEIYRALLDNQAGEHAARMTAMESATRNTEEMIERLTLQYNRARQAAITKELVEIVSGAEAL